jgi:hypothetical protein
VEVERAGCVAAAVLAPGLFPDDCSALVDTVLDDCSAAPQADGHSAPEAPLAGCWALAKLAADDSVQDDYSAPADSVLAERVLDDCWAAPLADDHSAPEVPLAGC